MTSTKYIFFILALICYVSSQIVAGTMTFRNPNCSETNFITYAYFTNTCFAHDSKYATLKCTGINSGYNFTTCEDSNCSQNCTTQTTAYGDCLNTSPTDSIKSFCNISFPREKFDYVSIPSVDCNPNSNTYSGTNGCFSEQTRVVCRNSSMISIASFKNGCNGNNYTIQNNDITTCTFGQRFVCQNFYPECYGKTSLFDTNTCGGVGKCVGYNNCSCPSTHLGTECKTLLTCFGVRSDDPNVCNGNGVCSGVDSCTCRGGWIGSTCNVAPCGGINATSPTVCSGNGNCTRLDTCACKTGYYGATCNIPSCGTIPATNSFACAGGRCVALDVCVCNPGRTGPSCQQISGSIQSFLSMFIVLVLILIQ